MSDGSVKDCGYISIKEEMNCIYVKEKNGNMEDVLVNNCDHISIKSGVYYNEIENEIDKEPVGKVGNFPLHIKENDQLEGNYNLLNKKNFKHAEIELETLTHINHRNLDEDLSVRNEISSGVIANLRKLLTESGEHETLCCDSKTVEKSASFDVVGSSSEVEEENNTLPQRFKVNLSAIDSISTENQVKLDPTKTYKHCKITPRLSAEPPAVTFSRKKAEKKKNLEQKHKENSKQNASGNESGKCFSNDKMEHMKKLAQMLSQKCVKNVSPEKSDSTPKALEENKSKSEVKIEDVVMISDEDSSNTRLPELSTAGTSSAKESPGLGPDLKTHKHKKRRKDKKKSRHRDAKFEGETIPHLVKTGVTNSSAAEVNADDGQNYATQDEYVLQKLFAKSDHNNTENISILASAGHGMRGGGGDVEMEPEFSVGDLAVKTLKIPGDGNCLFGAVAHQLYGSLPGTSDYAMNITHLRHAVAAHLWTNIEKFKLQTLDSISTSYDEAHPIHGWTDTAKIARFTNDIRKEGFWGSSESLAALADLYRVRITVYLEGSPLPIQFSPSRPNPILTISIAYRKSPVTGEYCHYESVVQANSYRIIKFSTWNVRGAADPSVRKNIDEDLLSVGDLVALQETHLSTGTADTRNFSWHCSGAAGTNRGVALLIRKSGEIFLDNFSAISDSLCMALIRWRDIKFTTICAYLPSYTDPCYADTAAHLIQALATAKPPLLLLGDFNAYLDFAEARSSHRTGEGLLCGNANENGIYLFWLANKYDLLFRSTFSNSPSELTTWSNGNQHSQIDFILSSDLPLWDQYSTSCIWGTLRSSDHKIVTSKCCLKAGDLVPPPPRKLNHVPWAISGLNNPCDKKNFQEKYLQLLRALRRERAQSLPLPHWATSGPLDDPDSRVNCLEIFGVPEKENENVMEIIKAIGVSLDTMIYENYVVGCHRYGPKRKGQHRGIIVKFTKQQICRDLLYKKTTKKKIITTHDIKMFDAPAEIVYVNESITPATRKIMNAAKALRKEKGYFNVFVSKGKVFLRKNVGDPLIHITSIDQLSEI